MELNGIANIHMMLDQSLENNEIDEFIHGLIKKQLDYVERYMLAAQDHIDSAEVVTNNGTVEVTHLKSLPYWHDILENPKKYPTLREKVANNDRLEGKDG